MPEIAGIVEKLETDKAIIKTANGEIITFLLNALGNQLHQGDQVIITLAKAEENENPHDILNAILDT